MFSSTGALGITYIIIIILAIAIGCFFYSSAGDRFKEYLKERFKSPPPPPRIDPHALYVPSEVVQLNDEPIIERNVYSPKEDRSPYSPTRKPCPFCGEMFIIESCEDGVWEYNTVGYVAHVLRAHRETHRDPRTVPCAVCSIYSFWSDDMATSGIQTANPYCSHCGGSGHEPVTVEVVDGKEIVRPAKVVISDDDLLMCPECQNSNESRITCRCCNGDGALTRREIKKMGYSAPKYYISL